MRWDLRQTEGPLISMTGREATLYFKEGDSRNRTLYRGDTGKWESKSESISVRIVADLYHTDKTNDALEDLYSRYLNQIMLADQK